MAEQAKKQAIQDIKEELARNHKCFLTFRSSLNKVMNQLVKEQLEEQQNISKKV